MTKREAIEALKQGQRITHRYFTKEEFVYLEFGVLIDEKGLHLSWSEFWQLRSAPAFKFDWSLYE